MPSNWNVKPPITEDATAVELRPSNHEPTFVPLDDFLQVDAASRPRIRVAVRGFLNEHCPGRHGVSFIAGRGKLIADLSSMAGKRVTFGEAVKLAQSALNKSQVRSIRESDARDLARMICAPAVDVR